MSAPHLHAPTDFGHYRVAAELATGYTALRCAAIAAVQLVDAAPTYRGTTGWDLQMAITDARTAIENAVCVHDLAKFNPFWAHPEPLTDLDVAHQLPDTAARDTLDHALRDTLSALRAAAEHAEDLVGSHHAYHHHYGYVGGLGWDLETAVDDALIAVRDAARTAELHTTHPEFWREELR